MDETAQLQQFKDFYEATKTPVFRAVLLARAGDRHAAEDAVADAYERAFMRWNKLAIHPNPTGWVIRTAMNQRISIWRKQRHQTVSPPKGAIENESGLDPHLVEMVRGLPKGQREVLALRILMDFSTEQTAEVLGVKQGTVKQQLHRALRGLREQLSAQHPEEVWQ